MRDIEEAIVRALVVAAKQERYIGFVSSAKRRQKFLNELYHFRDFNPAFIVKIPPRDQKAVSIGTLLRRRRAPEVCYVVSTIADIDATTMSLSGALVRIVGGVSDGTILSCISGRLAYFEGESPGDRFILERR
jgi:hypothetical protein